MPEPTWMTDELRLHLRRAAWALSREFEGVFSPETVERYVRESTERMPTPKIHDFVPTFVHRFARERLRALAQVEGRISKEVPEVLFLCVQNAGRSQMAAALLNWHAQGRVSVHSAGSTPANEIHQRVREALAELGIDLLQEMPKPWPDEIIRAADVVVTMGCGDACPIYPGKRYLDWEVPDPAGEPAEEVRKIRDDIDQRVRELLDELIASPTSA